MPPPTFGVLCKTLIIFWCKLVWKIRDFRPISCFISKMIAYKIVPESLWTANRKPYPSFQMVPFSMTWVTSNPDFKVAPLFDVEYLRNGSRHRHIYNEIPVGTYTRPMPTQGRHFGFEWPWVTWRNTQLHEASRSFSAIAEPFVFTCGRFNWLPISFWSHGELYRIVCW